MFTWLEDCKKGKKLKSNDGKQQQFFALFLSALKNSSLGLNLLYISEIASSIHVK